MFFITKKWEKSNYSYKFGEFGEQKQGLQWIKIFSV